MKVYVDCDTKPAIEAWVYENTEGKEEGVYLDSRYTNLVLIRDGNESEEFPLFKSDIPMMIKALQRAEEYFKGK